ncbi:hypothetical protein ABES02_27075 [Neobacillus pocheonensis]|uniref:ATPase, T2SS/T4P/T4SS family n=1 Tax=Neobacillus pocheonensis TaxID=363869 RepID=UPI003D2E695F
MGLLQSIQESGNQTGGGMKKEISSRENLSLTPKLKMITPFHVFGPIYPLILDKDVSEILVNGPNEVYCEQKGKILLTSIQFNDNEHLISIIKKIISTFGRRIDENSPVVDIRPSVDARIIAIIPPLASNGPMITITKYPKKI